MASAAEDLQQQDSQTFDDINQYIDELKGEAQGDYDFVVKYLKKQFESALGTDDTARAEFFTKVSNQLEERIGRIPYDYDLQTGREKEDYANFLKEKDMEDTDQRAQETEFKQQQDLAAKQEQKQITEGANERGMLDSGIEKRQQAEVAEERKVTQQDPQNRVFAYQQARRDEERRLGGVSSERNLADITTEARRGGQDEQFNYDKGSEGAERTLSKRLSELDRKKSSEMGLALDAVSLRNM